MCFRVARQEGGISLERLTDHENEHYNQPGCNSCSDYRWRSCKESGEIDDCIQRLTWLRLLDIEDILGDDYDLDRLRELVEADREGRCVVLPCKLHDKVFFIENGCVKETEVEAFHNWTSGRWKISTHTDRMFDHWKGYEIDFSGIGKTVFLTREAAEDALKGEQDG